MDWLSYIASIPLFALAYVDTLEGWKGRPRLMRALTVVAFIFALGAVLVSNRQHDKGLSTAQQSSAALKSQLSALQKSVSTLQTQNKDLLTRNQDLQNDMDGIRGKLKVPAKRVRKVEPEDVKVSDSVTRTPEHH
jgi:uncharacterized protein YoxC